MFCLKPQRGSSVVVGSLSPLRLYRCDGRLVCNAPSSAQPSGAQ